MKQFPNSRTGLTCQAYFIIKTISIAKQLGNWSFFEPAYGTGPEDGVGGEVKRAMWPSFL